MPGRLPACRAWRVQKRSFQREGALSLLVAAILGAGAVALDRMIAVGNLGVSLLAPLKFPSFLVECGGFLFAKYVRKAWFDFGRDWVQYFFQICDFHEWMHDATF